VSDKTIKLLISYDTVLVDGSCTPNAQLSGVNVLALGLRKQAK